jgi:anti-sigma regulatory factor (Ser/Thr protein kinase)
MADQWPLQSFLELGPLPGAVPCARLHVRHLLWEWKLTDFSEAAELVVSELLTNAVQASQAMEFLTPVRMWLLSDKQRVLILIWDASPQLPVRMYSRDDAENGRGLLLVETISTRWNWYFVHDSGGKVVWARNRSERNHGSSPVNWTVRHATGLDLPPVDDTVFLEPHRLRHVLETALAGTAGGVRVAGTLDRRLVFLEDRGRPVGRGGPVRAAAPDWAEP